MKKLIATIAAALLVATASFAEGYLSAEDFDLGTIGDVVNAEDGFVLNATTEKPMEIQKDGVPHSVGADKFTKRIKTGGSGNATFRNVEFPAKAGETINIYTLSSSKSDQRPIHVVAADGTEIALLSAPAYVEGGELAPLSVKAPADGNYKVWATSGTAYIYMIKVTK